MLLSIDGTIIFVFISFAVFLFLMKLICYKPILEVINKRNEFIRKNSETATRTNDKKEALIEETKNEISKTQLESSIMLKSAACKNKELEEEKIKNKKNEISNSLIQFEGGLKNEANAAKTELKGQIKEYVSLTVSKILNFDAGEIEIDDNKLDEILK